MREKMEKMENKLIIQSVSKMELKETINEFFITDDDKLYIKKTKSTQPIINWIREKFGDDINREMLMDINGNFRIHYTDFVVEYDMKN